MWVYNNIAPFLLNALLFLCVSSSAVMLVTWELIRRGNKNRRIRQGRKRCHSVRVWPVDTRRLPRHRDQLTRGVYRDTVTSWHEASTETLWPVDTRRLQRHCDQLTRGVYRDTVTSWHEASTETLTSWHEASTETPWPVDTRRLPRHCDQLTRGVYRDTADRTFCCDWSIGTTVQGHVLSVERRGRFIAYPRSYWEFCG